MPRHRLFFLCAVVVFGLFIGCARAEPSRAEFALGTICSVSLFDQAKAGVYQEIFSRIREIENRMSVNLPGTDIDRINAAAGVQPVQVHDDVFGVIRRAVHFANVSGGAFDPTVGPLVSLWGISGDNPRVPSQAEIDAVLPLINWQNIELDPAARSVFLKQPGMALDLGAIAKGYAADEAAAIVKKSRIKRAIIDLGGNIITCGEKKDKSLWKVGIQNPVESRGAYLGIVQAREQCVVTSGVYERYFEADGVRYHHIFSPSMGYPVRNDLLSVTIIASNSMDADALSTAAFVLGYEKARALIESLEGIEAVFVFADKSVRKTKGADFIVTDAEYRLAP
jgi:thiamine biosynthesis lipoprotein